MPLLARTGAYNHQVGEAFRSDTTLHQMHPTGIREPPGTVSERVQLGALLRVQP